MIEASEILSVLIIGVAMGGKMELSADESFRRGKLEWERWKVDFDKRYPGEAPDLGDLDLSCLDLQGFDFSHVYLMRSTFRDSNLQGADLSQATLNLVDMRSVALQDANLAGAFLNDANFSGASAAGAFCRETSFRGANFSGADLSNAYLEGAVCIEANFSNAVLKGAILKNADLSKCNLQGADLTDAYLAGANLTEADLERATIRSCDLTHSRLIGTNLRNAVLEDCSIYGISVWALKAEGAYQTGLIISNHDEPPISVDNLQVAQFIHLILNNEAIRDAIDTISAKAVLILGRFSPGRKVVLEGLKSFVRERGYLPILFDFDKPMNRDLTETVSILAHLSKFVIADITEPRSIPQELLRIVPDLPSVPVISIIQNREREYGMFEHFSRYPWVFGPFPYDDLPHAISILKTQAPANSLL